MQQDELCGVQTLSGGEGHIKILSRWRLPCWFCLIHCCCSFFNHRTRKEALISLLFGFPFLMAQCMALSLLCCLPKKLDAKEREDLGEQVENGQPADHDGKRVGHYIVGKTIGVASHQPFLVYQVQNSK